MKQVGSFKEIPSTLGNSSLAECLECVNINSYFARELLYVMFKFEDKDSIHYILEGNLNILAGDTDQIPNSAILREIFSSPHGLLLIGKDI